MAKERQNLLIPNRRGMIKSIGTIGIVGAVGNGTVSAQSGAQQISDWNDLHAIRDDLNGEYILATDLDESTAGYEEYVADPETGFEPIGKTQTEFTGTFDGQGNEIRTLVIEKPDSEPVGLFGLAGEGAVIENITLVDVEITGDYDVGALIGGSNGTINTSAVTGAVSGRRNVGGIVGRNRKAIIRDSAAGVTITGESNVGGLVGKNDNKIRNSWATGEVTGDSSVGGLVGLHSYTGFTPGTIIESWASGDVEGDSTVGGLVGDSFHNDLEGEIMTSAASGTVTGESEVGGLIGSTSASTIITNSVALGQVTGTEDVGGFAGYNKNTISNSFSCGAVTGDQQIGGFLGSNSGEVTDSYWDLTGSDQSESIGRQNGDSNNITGLSTVEMQGKVAENNMSALDFDGTWEAVTNPADYPVLSSLTDNRDIQYLQQQSYRDDVPTEQQLAGETESSEQDLEELNESGTQESVTENESTQQEATDDASSDSTPGFGITGSIVAFGGAGYIIKRRLTGDQVDE